MLACGDLFAVVRFRSFPQIGFGDVACKRALEIPQTKTDIEDVDWRHCPIGLWRPSLQDNTKMTHCLAQVQFLELWPPIGGLSKA